jgi:hypothetical protein
MAYPKKIEKRLVWRIKVASIEININQLHSRVNIVGDLLVPLRKKSLPVACEICRHQSLGCKVIAAHDGVSGNKNYRSMYFKTFATNILGQYYEFWKPIDKQGKLCLNRAYLNVFIVNRNTHNYDKVVSIHCDPYEEDGEASCLYKRGPHLHVQKAEYPIPKCHFPLNFTELDNILSSIDNISEALKNAIKIVQGEVLIRYKKLML